MGILPGSGGIYKPGKFFTARFNNILLDALNRYFYLVHEGCQHYKQHLLLLLLFNILII